MSAQHTPGPWAVHLERTAGIGGTIAVFVCGIGEWPESQIARVNTQDGLNEHLANARLISATPDLLAACRLAIAYDEGDESDHVALMLAYADAFDAIRAAIAKATGA